jgi:predicted aconitase with swiveling domain
MLRGGDESHSGATASPFGVGSFSGKRRLPGLPRTIFGAVGVGFRTVIANEFEEQVASGALTAQIPIFSRNEGERRFERCVQNFRVAADQQFAR